MVLLINHVYKRDEPHVTNSFENGGNHLDHTTELSSSTEATKSDTNVIAKKRKRRPRKFYKNPWIITPMVFLLILLILGAIILRSFAFVPVSSDGLQDAITTITNPDVAMLQKVGIGTITKKMRYVNGQPIADASGKPVFLFVGAEFCPFCAAQRWATIVALSRFGTFGQLTPVTTVEAGLPSFSFHHITYQSDLIELQTREIKDNQFPFPQPYETMTPLQSQLVQKYDVPPNAGIPFVDVNNKYVSVGSYYDPDDLQVSSYREVNNQLHAPQSKIAQGIYGSANYLTAAICEVTSDKPASVCTSPLIISMKQHLPH